MLVTRPGGGASTLNTNRWMLFGASTVSITAVTEWSSDGAAKTVNGDTIDIIRTNDNKSAVFFLKSLKNLTFLAF
jgi:hypothetical protein